MTCLRKRVQNVICCWNKNRLNDMNSIAMTQNFVQKFVLSMKRKITHYFCIFAPAPWLSPSSTSIFYLLYNLLSQPVYGWIFLNAFLVKDKSEFIDEMIEIGLENKIHKCNIRIIYFFLKISKHSSSENFYNIFNYWFEH